MLIEFNQQLQAQNTIDIDNIGTFGIRATTDEGTEYYMVAKTVFGMTHILDWGPVFPDMDMLINNYHCKYSKIEFNELKLEKTVTYWLNEKTKKITGAELIEPDEALSSVINVRKQMWNIEDMTYGD